ncbi:hypothetical protein Tco_1000001 [Tanacetum coccineum]
MVAPAMDMEEDLAVLFGDDDDSGDDDSEGPEGDEEVLEMDEEWLIAPVTPSPMTVMPLPSTYEVGGSSTTVVEEHSLTLLAHGVLCPPHQRGTMYRFMASQMPRCERLEQVGSCGAGLSSFGPEYIRMRIDQQPYNINEQFIATTLGSRMIARKKYFDALHTWIWADPSDIEMNHRDLSSPIVV